MLMKGVIKNMWRFKLKFRIELMWAMNNKEVSVRDREMSQQQRPLATLERIWLLFLTLTWQLTTTHNSLFQELQCPLLTSLTLHACGTQTYMQAEHLYP